LIIGLTPAAASEVDTYRLYIDAYSRGKIDEAVQFFAADAIVTVGPMCSRDSPCIGRAAIRERYLRVLLARGTPPPVTDQRFDGRWMRTRGESNYLMGADGSVVRLLGGHVFELSGRSIASLHYEFDREDPGTLRYLNGLGQAGWFVAGSDPR
jgi:hypothetical protein